MMTLNEVIEQFELLRRRHGGNTECVIELCHPQFLTENLTATKLLAAEFHPDKHYGDWLRIMFEAERDV